MANRVARFQRRRRRRRRSERKLIKGRHGFRNSRFSLLVILAPSVWLFFCFVSPVCVCVCVCVQ